MTMRTVQMRPEDEAAKKYMAYKGYPDVVPVRVEQVEGELCWYYLYDLDEDHELELEVDFQDGEWNFTVFFDDPERD
jgi:hypothetical protein